MNDFEDLEWFGYKLGYYEIFGLNLCLAQIHRRFDKNAHKPCASQGIGLLQIAKQHLFYLGTNEEKFYLCVLFMWLSQRTPH